jgi:hypothetical protein
MQGIRVVQERQVAVVVAVAVVPDQGQLLLVGYMPPGIQRLDMGALAEMLTPEVMAALVVANFLAPMLTRVRVYQVIPELLGLRALPAMQEVRAVLVRLLLV